MRARGWGCGELSRERHRAADRGRGAAGAGQSRPGSPGRSWCWGPRSAMGPAPCPAGTNPAEHHPWGRILVEAGGVPHRPLAAEPDRDGPRRMDTGGAGGAGHRGSEARVPVVRGPARGRPGGPWGCGWGGEGREGCAGSGPNPEWPPGAGRGPPRAAAPWGGGGVLPARGTTGAPLERGGGGGRVSPGVGCRFMAARHGTISPTLHAGVPFLGGLGGGGGGWRLLCAPTHAGGGRRWELRPAWPKKPGGVPWARGPLGGGTSDSPGGTPLLWPHWYGLSVLASVVWPQWYGISGMASVVWPQWHGLSGMALVEWPQWYGRKCMASVVWPQWYGLRGMASVVWPQWYGLSGMASVVWPQWYGLSGMALVEWPQWHGLSGMASVVWPQWCGLSGTASVV